MQARRGVVARTHHREAGNFSASAVEELVQAGVAYLAARVAKAIEDSADGLDRLVTPHGPLEHATVSGIQAAVAGKNPLWAAVKGAWSSGTVKTRIVMVLLAVAVLLTAVVAVVVLLLTMLIEAVGAAIRALTH
jgi:hypothetical protein